MSRGKPVILRHGASALVASLALALVSVGVVTAAEPRVSSIERYALEGYEVWYTSTVGTFVGAGGGEDRAISRLAGWHASIEHTEIITPTGRVTGGTATLYRLDGVRISGTFVDGVARQVVAGENCTTERHAVSGMLNGVTRSNASGVSGVGFFEATLTHYRAFIFGRCYSYSASVEGSITVAI